ncbi:MAG TPA: PAS domain S-box protein, partial [Fusibacter sp.]|nr:PAS domain S-box protein [Fusibacter sp.]
MSLTVPNQWENDSIHLNQTDFDVFDRLISMPTLILNAEKVLFVNAGFKHVFGFDAEALNQKSILSFINPVFVNVFETTINRALAGETYVDQGELCVKTKDRNIFWVEHKSRVVTYNDAPHVLMHLMEINEKKRVESHLSRLLKLRESMLE